MYIKFSDKQLKVVSDSSSECLFWKNFLGGMSPDPPRKLVPRNALVDTKLLPYDHAVSEMANQIWFRLAILS